MDLSHTASFEFKRRTAHYHACCRYVASKRDHKLLAGIPILDLVFLGHHTATTDIKEALAIPKPQLSEAIQEYKNETKFDIFSGWHTYCNAQSDPRLKALAVFGKYSLQLSWRSLMLKRRSYIICCYKHRRPGRV